MAKHCITEILKIVHCVPTAFTSRRCDFLKNVVRTSETCLKCFRHSLETLRYLNNHLYHLVIERLIPMKSFQNSNSDRSTVDLSLRQYASEKLQNPFFSLSLTDAGLSRLERALRRTLVGGVFVLEERI